MSDYIDDAHIHHGHRRRMRDKLKTHGQGIFDTYELLEMLLYHVIPYKDTNPIAKRLLHKFGSLDGVMTASRDDLISLDGVGERAAELIMLVGDLFSVIGTEILPRDELIFSDREQVGEFLVDYFSHRDGYAVVALFFDNDLRLIDFADICALDYASGGVKSKDIIDIAIREHATAVITAHNHIHGPLFATQGDRATNELVTADLDMAGIRHIDHFLICGDMYALLSETRELVAKLARVRSDGDDGLVMGEENTKFIRARGKRLSGIIDKLGYNEGGVEYLNKLLCASGSQHGMEYATQLISRYRTVEGALNAPVEDIEILCDARVAVFVKLLAYITSRRTTDTFAFGKPHSSVEIADYFKALFLGLSIECVYVMSLGAKGEVVDCRRLCDGTVNSSSIIPRKVLEIATSTSAASVILAHNHPYGNTCESADDVAMTSVLSRVLSNSGIKLLDHYIVAGQLCDRMRME